MTQSKSAGEISQPQSPQTIGARIAQARRALGLREGRDILPANVAEAVGVSAQSVYNWEGDVSPPGEKNLERLAEYLGVTPAYLRYGVVPLRDEQYPPDPRESPTEARHTPPAATRRIGGGRKR